jgi:glutathione S-transferase
MIIVNTTKNCPNTPRILFAFEELALDYRCELVADGTFSSTYGSPGPEIVDGDVRTIEPGSILRHLVRREHGKLWPTSLADQATADRWIDFQTRRLSGAHKAKDAAEVERLLGFAEAHLATRTWFFGELFTIVDVVWSLYALPASKAMIPLAKLPAFAAYIERVAARPAYARGFERALR